VVKVWQAYNINKTNITTSVAEDVAITDLSASVAVRKNCM